MVRAVPRITLCRYSQRKYDAVPQHQEHGSRARMTRAEDGVAGHEGHDGRCEKEEIPALEKAPSRCHLGPRS